MRFGELEAILADINFIPSAQRTAFQSRLKNFHRLGFPKNLGGVKGKAVQYGVGEIIQMGIAVEMTQLGLNPERAIDVIGADQTALYHVTRLAADELLKHLQGRGEGDRPYGYFLYFDPSALAPWPDGAILDLASASFYYAGEKAIMESFSQWTGGATRRLALINVTTLLDQLLGAWEPDENKVEVRGSQFLKDAARWADWCIHRGDFDPDEWVQSRLRGRLSEFVYRPQQPVELEGLDMKSVVDKMVPDADDAIDGILMFREEDDSPILPAVTVWLPAGRSLRINALPDGFGTEQLIEAIEAVTARERSRFSDRTKYEILYAPNAGPFYQALEADRELWRRAFDAGLIIVTPAMLVDFVEEVERAHTAAYAWRNAPYAEQARTLMEGVLQWRP